MHLLIKTMSGLVTNMYIDKNDNYLPDCRNYLNSKSQFLSYFGNSILLKITTKNFNYVKININNFIIKHGVLNEKSNLF